ncbi:hypothetical protein FOA52_003498 [Chlamydomonas sp. UWO 241]|nr:hypothetical protein FOA52_003498 [Chlamydomonas sp. UWO 241]
MSAKNSDISRKDTNSRMSEIVVFNKMVYLAGQVPSSTDKDMKGQAGETLAEIERMLLAAGTDKSRILMATVYILDFKEFAAFNEVWEAWVEPGHTPARATVEVSRLADPGWKIEIAVTAAMP